MKKFFLLMFMTSLMIFSAMADVIVPGQPRGARERNREAHGFSFEQFQEDKCNFIIREMELTEAEVEKFLPVYKELMKAKNALYRKYGGSHRVMRSVNEGRQVADSTMQRAAQDARQLQLEDAKLEQEYLQKFEKILTPVQIIKLQEAEQKFKNEMMQRAPRPHRAR